MANFKNKLDRRKLIEDLNQFLPDLDTGFYDSFEFATNNGPDLSDDVTQGDIFTNLEQNNWYLFIWLEEREGSGLDSSSNAFLKDGNDTTIAAINVNADIGADAANQLHNLRVVPYFMDNSRIYTSGQNLAATRISKSTVTAIKIPFGLINKGTDWN